MNVFVAHLHRFMLYDKKSQAGTRATARCRGSGRRKGELLRELGMKSAAAAYASFLVVSSSSSEASEEDRTSEISLNSSMRTTILRMR